MHVIPAIGLLGGYHFICWSYTRKDRFKVFLTQVAYDPSHYVTSHTQPSCQVVDAVAPVEVDLPQLQAGDPFSDDYIKVTASPQHF